jgi:hypothetical protein
MPTFAASAPLFFRSGADGEIKRPTGAVGIYATTSSIFRRQIDGSPVMMVLPGLGDPAKANVTALQQQLQEDRGPGNSNNFETGDSGIGILG